MKTIICPNYLKNELINKLLEKNNFLTGTKIVPLNVFLKINNDISDEELYLSALKTLNNLKNSLKVYHHMIQYPAFVCEIVDFIKEIILYDIDLNTLTTSNPQTKELKYIIENLIDLPFNEHHIKNINIPSTEDLYIVDYFSKNAFEYKIKEYLLKNNAKLISLSKVENPVFAVKYALNKREEIEAIAQDICLKQNAFKAAIICCDKPNQLPIIKQVFERYNIPVKNMDLNFKSHIITGFISICNLYLNKDIDSLLEFISICNIKNHKKVYDYLNQYVKDPLQLPDDIIDKEIIEQIHDILNSEIKNILTLAYNIIIKKFNNKEIILKIRDILENTYYLVENNEDLLMVLYSIEKIQTNETRNLAQGVTITTLNKPIYACEDVYVLGCTSRLYPGFKSLSGIFDEKYVKNTNYPKLEERYNQYFEQLKWLEKAGNNIFFSYHESDLNGKNVEAAFELLAYGKESKWHINQTDYLIKREHSLKEETAKSLFLKKGILKGSVSSLETYFKCAYRYFISYGLNIKSPFENEIGADTIGNIIHEILQKIVFKNPKKYYEENLTEILNKLKEKLLSDFPKEESYIELLFMNIKDNLLLNFEYIKEMETDTGFKNIETEFKFEDYQLIPNKILIKGFIDRIDIAYNYLRIIDYKTGSKEISISDIEKGLSLQLLTYLKVACDLFNKKAMGAFYYVLENRKIKAASNEYENFIKEKRMNGLIFDQLETMSHQHLTKMYNIKTGKGKYKILDFKDTSNKIMQIYETLYNDITKGKIDTNPCVAQCTYCPYLSICRHNKQESKKEPIVSLLEEKQ